MQDKPTWDDMKLVLAVSRAGSLAGASRTLAVNHATVFRRLNALESAMEVRLFERARGGYAPTSAGDDMAATAARMETEMLGAVRRLVGRDSQPSGTVRLTTTDTLFHGLVAPMLADCRCDYPDIEIEATLSNEPLNLTRRHADMAVRPVPSPPEALIAQRLGQVAMAVYVPAAWQAREPFLYRQSDWIGLDDQVRFPAFADWMRYQGLEQRCGLRADSVQGMADLVSAGAGCALLPCYLGDRDPSLRRVTGLADTPRIPLWLLIHPDLRRTARVRAIRDSLAASFAEPAVQCMLAGAAQPV